MTDPTRDDRQPCCGERPVGITLEDCHNAMDALEELLDRDITPDDRIVLEQHLHVCEHCTQEYDLRSRVQEILRAKLCNERCPETLRATISAMIHEECEGC